MNGNIPLYNFESSFSQLIVVVKQYYGLSSNDFSPEEHSELAQLSVENCHIYRRKRNLSYRYRSSALMVYIPVTLTDENLIARSTDDPIQIVLKKSSSRYTIPVSEFIEQLG